MKAQNYHSSISANITAKQAIEAISDVPSWWATNFEGHSKKTGDVFSIRFGDTFVRFKIMEVVAGNKVIWHVEDCWLPFLKENKTEWTNTSILWEISTKNDSTQIDMTHIGLVPEVECYDVCEKGWNHFVKESLFKLLTEHRGLPEGSGTVRQR